MDKKEYIRKLGSFLINNGKTMDVPNLVEHLNWNGYKTNYGTEYQGGRGSYRLIRSTYDWLIKIGEPGDAKNVAEAFMKPDGTYAYL